MQFGPANCVFFPMNLNAYKKFGSSSKCRIRPSCATPSNWCRNNYTVSLSIALSVCHLLYRWCVSGCTVSVLLTIQQVCHWLYYQCVTQLYYRYVTSYLSSVSLAILSICCRLYCLCVVGYAVSVLTENTAKPSPTTLSACHQSTRSACIVCCVSMINNIDDLAVTVVTFEHLLVVKFEFHSIRLAVCLLQVPLKYSSNLLQT